MVAMSYVRSYFLARHPERKGKGDIQKGVGGIPKQHNRSYESFHPYALVSEFTIYDDRTNIVGVKALRAILASQRLSACRAKIGVNIGNLESPSWCDGFTFGSC